MQNRRPAKDSVMISHDLDTVLDFWFGPMADGFSTEDRDFWFRSTPEKDAEIRTRFEPLVLAAAAGELDAWKSTPRGRLALVILLDQFPRNIYRGTDRAFAFDARTKRLVEEGVACGDDLELPFEQRAFFYLPLVHQESEAAQQRCVELYERLQAEIPREHRGRTEPYLRSAHQHRDIIRRFGRFPHRNRALQRSSTADEEEYLRQSKGSFGQ